VIFCLGNTEGLPCSDITERTLITKGTLTGVIDRLEQKGLVQRWGDTEDGRKIIVDLTRLGERVFQREFPRYVDRLKPLIDGLSARDRDQATNLLNRIADLF
jgi:DNA-binding MarR family transcriptional regulator